MLPQLQTSRLLLRQLQPSDADDVFVYAGDQEVSTYLSWKPHHTVDDSRAFIEMVNQRIADGGAPLWGVECDGHIIGTGSFLSMQKTHKYADIGYVIGRPWWGNGYAPEVARALVDYGFGELDLWRIEAQVRITNDRSGRVLEKAGFEQEAVLHGRFYIDGKHHDSRLYAVMRETWDSGLQPLRTL